MSSPIWTPDALASEARPLKGSCWRLVEAQHRVSTLKLVDTLAEQASLERWIEATKPAVPPECRHLHYLLATPFRYGAPYPFGSRFRRPGYTPGVYYASQHIETAVAELAFHRLLFFADSPAMPWPDGASEFTGFAVRFADARGLDLTRAPLADDRPLWVEPTDYRPCQTLADAARRAGSAAIRYESVRDPAGRPNLALLDCRAFVSTAPERWQTWRVRFGAHGIQAIAEAPAIRLEFGREAFAADPRMAGFAWER